MISWGPLGCHNKRQERRTKESHLLMIIILCAGLKTGIEGDIHEVCERVELERGET